MKQYAISSGKLLLLILATIITLSSLSSALYLWLGDDSFSKLVILPAALVLVMLAAQFFIKNKPNWLENATNLYWGFLFCLMMPTLLLAPDVGLVFKLFGVIIFVWFAIGSMAKGSSLIFVRCDEEED